MFFTVSYDRTTQIVTGVIAVLLLWIAIASQTLLGALPLLILVIGYAFSPRGYSVEGREIVVHRPFRGVRFPLDDLQEARPAGKDDFRGCIRLFGSGGLFGYYGLFRTSKLGKCTWYVTNRGKAVVARIGSRTVLFSPDDADGFLATLRAEAPRGVSTGFPSIASSNP